MLVISIGMKKSGSAYLYNIVNDILSETGGVDAREVKEKYSLNGLMKWHNNNIGDISLLTLMRLYRVTRKEGAFVVKTHEAPGIAAKLFNKAGKLKFIYSYRDPRDALLSAIDHGNRIIAAGEYHTFAKIADFEVALETVNGWIDIWKTCSAIPNLLMIRYEDMMEAPHDCLRKLEKHLEIRLDESLKEQILWRYSKDNPEGDRTGLHFNKAKIYRYRKEMTNRQKTQCRERFGKSLIEMGYSID